MSKPDEQKSKPDEQNDFGKLVQVGLFVVAGISIVFALLHVFFPDRFDEKTAIFLAVAVVSLVIYQMRRFSGWGIEFEMQGVKKEVSVLKDDVRALQVAIKGLVTEYEFDKLVGLEADGPFNVYYSHRMYDELRRLITLHFVKTTAGDIRDLLRLKEQDGSNNRFDLKHYVTITDEGREYVRLRQHTAELTAGPDSDSQSSLPAQ